MLVDIIRVIRVTLKSGETSYIVASFDGDGRWSRCCTQTGRLGRENARTFAETLSSKIGVGYIDRIIEMSADLKSLEIHDVD